MSGIITQLKHDVNSGQRITSDLDDEKQLAEELANKMSMAEDCALEEVETLVTFPSKSQVQQQLLLNLRL